MSQAAYTSNAGEGFQAGYGGESAATSNAVHGSDEGDVSGSGRAGQFRMELTDAEVEILKQCRRDSFWQRSLPLGVALMGAVQVLARRGALAVHPRWGALPKTFGAGILGYLIGKVSYAGTCRDRLLRVDGGTIAQAVKARRERPLDQRDLGSGQYDRAVSQVQSEAEGDQTQDDSSVAVPRMTTYDSLRRQHRQEQEAAAQHRHPAGYSDFPRRSHPPREAPPESSGDQRGGKGKNKYGDVWEE